MMRVTLLPAALICFACISAPASLAFEPSGIVVAEKSVDFGIVPRGAKRAYTFSVENPSGRSIRIVSIRVPCGCVTANALQREIPPGKTASINAVLDTTRFAGPLNKVFYVLFEGAQTEEIRFSMNAVSQQGLFAEPSAFTFGDVKEGKKAEQSIVLTLLDPSLKQTWKAECESAYVEARIQPIPDAEGSPSYRITASLRADLPAGNWHTTLRLVPEVGSAQPITFPLTVLIKP